MVNYKIIKHSFQDDLKSGTINGELLFNIVKLFVKKHRLGYYVQKINITDSSLDNDLGAMYDYENKIIVFALKEIVKEIYEEIENGDQAYDHQMIYFELLTFLFHELAHAMQAKHLDFAQLDDLRKILLLDSFDFSSKEYDLYLKNESIVPSEHEADILGGFEAFDFICKYGCESAIDNKLDYYNSALAYYLINKYSFEKDKILSPTEKFYLAYHGNIEKIPIFEMYKPSVTESLRFGLPIPEEVFYELNAIFVEDKKIKEPIKEFIKRY